MKGDTFLPNMFKHMYQWGIPNIFFFGRDDLILKWPLLSDVPNIQINMVGLHASKLQYSGLTHIILI